MRKYMLLAVPAMLLVAVATACGGGGGSKTVNIPGGGKVSVNTDKLPSDFPSDFPVYSGANYQGSFTGGDKTSKGTAATWQTGDSVDKVKSYYADQLGGKSNWKQVATTDTSGSVSFVFQQKDDSNKGGVVIISSQDNKTQILVTVGTGLNTGGSGDSTPSDGSSSSSDKSPSSSSSSGSATEAPSSQPLPAEATLSGDFPKDRVPFPSGARVTSSSNIASGGQQMHIVEIYVKDSADKVNDYFKTELAKHDWTSSTTSNQNGQYFQYWGGAAEGEGVIVSIEKSDTDGYVKVTLSVTTKS